MSWSWVAYTDETYNSEAYWICGVIVHIDNIRVSQDRLRGVLEDCAAAGGPRLTELHGHNLWHGNGPCEGVEPWRRVQLYARALDIVADLAPRIVLRGVARGNLRSHPHRIAWRYAIESVDEEIEREVGMVLIVGDEHAETEHALRTDIADYAEAGTGGWKPRTITRVLPQLKFLSSVENPLLQAADLVAFLAQRRAHCPTERVSRAQAARERLWRKIESYVVVHRLWSPPGSRKTKEPPEEAPG